jgi:Tfp pilus assembly protein PilP
MKRFAMLSALALLSACETATSNLPCPRVTQWPAELQRQAADELDRLPPGSALRRIIEDTAQDRAFNAAVCRRAV